MPKSIYSCYKHDPSILIDHAPASRNKSIRGHQTHSRIPRNVWAFAAAVAAAAFATKATSSAVLLQLCLPLSQKAVGALPALPQKANIISTFEMQ